MYMSANNIKITKVKPWAIYFNYKNRKFLIHESSDCCEYSTTLYERVLRNNKYELKSIKSYYGRIFTLNYLNNKTGRTYNQINKEKFLTKLVFYEMVTNKKIEKKIERIKKKIGKYKKIEHEYNRKRLELEYQIFR